MADFAKYNLTIRKKAKYFCSRDIGKRHPPDLTATWCLPTPHTVSDSSALLVHITPHISFSLGSHSQEIPGSIFSIRITFTLGLGKVWNSNNVLGVRGGKEAAASNQSSQKTTKGGRQFNLTLLESHVQHTHFLVLLKTISKSI